MPDNDNFSREPMLEMFIFETVQLIEQLEEMLIRIEQDNDLPAASINEIFRIMHTIKGSSAMMSYDSVSILAHSLEDLFDTIRSGAGEQPDCGRLTDIVLQAADFIKGEIGKAESGEVMDGDSSDLTGRIRGFNGELRSGASAGTPAWSAPSLPQKAAAPTVHAESSASSVSFGESANNEGVRRYVARIFFEDGCLMENMRAFTVVHSLKGAVTEMRYFPADIADNEDSSASIRETGFQIQFTSTKEYDAMLDLLNQTMFLDRLEFDAVDAFPNEEEKPAAAALPAETAEAAGTRPAAVPEPGTEVRVTAPRQQSLISVNTEKLDRLLDLVGEMVIAEAMTIRNPELEGLRLDGFRKAARQLGKLTNELQDIVMSLRMVTIAATFHRMQRIVRDMTRKLGKEVDLILSGEETELDKNIIDHISDPLMHLIRNSLDHGIESPAERAAAGKPDKGTLNLEARSVGGDILITIRDDGRGLNRARILAKARERGLLNRPDSEYSDKEAFAFIMLPGFSTKDNVSEFSGRGVGMDVVRDNISKVGGAISLDSQSGKGTVITIRIPLTLAIIDGMLVSVGVNRYIIPINAIRESFRARPEQIIEDTEGNEMVMIRGECLNIVRLHERFGVESRYRQLSEGIIIVMEDDDSTVCLFADELLGEQQAVVKPLPGYVKKARGVAGCTILGDGGICLILDANGLMADINGF